MAASLGKPITLRHGDSERSLSTMNKMPESKSKWKTFLHTGAKDRQFNRAQSAPEVRLSQQQVVTEPKIHHQGLEKKYGKCGRVVGDGAGGSVELVTRPSDGVTFAVKRFRTSQAWEDEKLHKQKIVAEFRIGSLLSHGNIIETLDLFEERGQWYQVMEYAPYDLFESVLSRKMSAEEINCSFFQILDGVQHIHRLGLAHRDLKLENVVVTGKGIMKLIDFGTAAPCRNLRTKEVILTSGVVGCSSYMAPEVLQKGAYDPQCADIWSLAIMYCCMVIGRFPWKLASPSVDEFALFSTVPPAKSVHKDRGMGRRLTEPSTPQMLNGATPMPLNLAKGEDPSLLFASLLLEQEKREAEEAVGPWRLLRRLPCHSREMIGEMLLLNPQRRPSVQQIRDNVWVKQSRVCRQDNDGRVHRADGHEHTLCRTR